jgi:hypothetical protein
MGRELQRKILTGMMKTIPLNSRDLKLITESLKSANSLKVECGLLALKRTFHQLFTEPALNPRRTVMAKNYANRTLDQVTEALAAALKTPGTFTYKAMGLACKLLVHVDSYSLYSEG